MPQLFVFRSQAFDAAVRELGPGKQFRTALHEETGMWKYWYEPGDHPAPEWEGTGFDFVHHVETAWVDKTRVGVLIVSCRKDEITPEEWARIEAEGLLVEPLTPGLWSKGDDKPEPKARNATTGARARSDVESPTKLVWQIADEMPNATRKDIIAACVARGVHPSTASTQYSRWNKARS